MPLVFLGAHFVWAFFFHGVAHFGTDYNPFPELQEHVLNTEENKGVC